jgi:hypothetical protein
LVRDELLAQFPDHTNGDKYTADDLDKVVEVLNQKARQLAASPPEHGELYPQDCACSCHREPRSTGKDACSECVCGTNPARLEKTQAVPATLTTPAVPATFEPLSHAARLSRAGQWWQRLVQRRNATYDEVEMRVDKVVGYPSSRRHQTLEEHAAQTAAAADAGALGGALGDGATATPQTLPDSLRDDRQQILNACNRHTTCRAGSCLRRDPKTGKLFCRFKFPQQKSDYNEYAHFFCERVKTGIRWSLYLPMNDPFMNGTNAEHAASQRSNTDFKPLIDHHSAIEYITKCARPGRRRPSVRSRRARTAHAALTRSSSARLSTRARANTGTRPSRRKARPRSTSSRRTCCVVTRICRPMRRLARSSPPSSAGLWADATGRRKKWRT